MLHLLYLIVLLCPFVINAEGPAITSQKKTVCLNMIVKNESTVITRCFSTLLPIIDYWVIVDTGSTDGTQDIIKDYMKSKGVPGELFERPWKNFEHNRNEALDLARNKSDYIMFIDADEWLRYEDGFALPHLDKDFYYITMDYSGMKYAKVMLINSKLDWKWVGVLHEVVTSSQARTHDTIPKVFNIYTTDGARSKDPQKYQKDAKILEDALKEEPNNSRYVFYLAQSYRDAREHDKSIATYQKRVEMGGWDQEVFYSMLMIASLQEQSNKPAETVLNSYYRAYQYRPSRAEPLYRLANYYNRNRNFAAGYLLSSIGLTLPVSKDILFVDHWVWEYGMLLEFSISSYWVGRYEEAKQASELILTKPNIPQNVRDAVENNLKFANEKVKELQRVKSPIVNQTAITPLTPLPL